jgi:hypothetical protein
MSPSVATLRLESLEMARGHDGPLRGAPEAAVILAILGCSASHATLLDRRIARFPPPRDVPCTMRPRESVVMAPMLDEADTHALVLAIGVEVDDGRDLERIFGALEDADAWTAARLDDDVPLRAALGSLATVAVGRTLRVGLALAGEAIEDGRFDDVVGASLTSLPAHTRTRRDARLGLRSPDARNDWTALARVGVRTGRPRS